MNNETKIYKGDEIKTLPWSTKGTDGLMDEKGVIAWNKPSFASHSALLDVYRERGWFRVFETSEEEINKAQARLGEGKE